jgi:hypothetical protein
VILLIDKILAGAELCQPVTADCSVDEWKRVTKGFVAQLRNCVVFNIDNVAEYFYANTEQEEFSLDKDFPNLAPPFPKFWMETIRPSKIRSCLHGVQSSSRFPSRWGVLFEGIPIGDFPAGSDQEETARKHLETSDPVDIERVTRMLAESIRDGQAPAMVLSSLDRQDRTLGVALMNLAYISHGDERLLVQVMGDPIKWMLMGTLAVVEGGRIYGPCDTRICGLTGDGRAPLGGHITIVIHGARAITSERWKIVEKDTAWFPQLLAISLSHCKNVTEVDHVPSKPLTRAFWKKHHRRPLTYKTLMIKPMAKLLSDVAAKNGTGLPKALHICRGHFKDYRERGLFGKIHGVFWWENSVRGRDQSRAVVKDYACAPARS